MRVLMVLAGGSPGGGTTFILQLLQALAKDSENTYALAVDDGSLAQEEAQRMGIQTYAVPLQQGRFSSQNVARLQQVFTDFSPDIIHAHGSRAGFYCARAKAQKAALFAYTVHGYHLLSKPFYLRPLSMMAERFTSSAAHMVINVGGDEFALATRLHLVPRKTQRMLIPNGVIIAATHGFDPARITRKHIICLGRLSPEKRPLLCLDAFSHLAAHGYEMTFVGGGALQPQIETRIAAEGWQKSVRCTGLLPHGEALAALDKGSVLLMPSKAEAFGIAVLEAYATGMPAVGARVHGLQEIIHDGKTGYSIPSDNPKDYADAIIRVHADAARYEAFVTEGQRIFADFSHDKVVEKHRVLYRTLRENS